MYIYILLNGCICTTYVPDAQGGQKETLCSLELHAMASYEPACEWWELNPCPLQEDRQGALHHEAISSAP